MSPDALEAARAALHRDGFARLGAVLDPAVVARVREGATALGHAAPPGENPYGALVHNVWRLSPACAAVVREGQVAALARALLAIDEVLFFQDLLIAKQPGTKAQTPLMWHQDYSYWPLDRPRGVIVWVALDDCTVANGCLHYVSGSHLGGERRPADFAGGGVEMDRPDLPPLDVAQADREAVAVPVAAGEAIAHDPLVLHMSPVNLTAHPRRAWSTTWLAPPVRWAPGHAAHPYNWELRPEPGSLVAGAPFVAFRGATE